MFLYIKFQLNSFFKACVRYFFGNFYFSPNNSPLRTTKKMLFDLKSSFHSREIQICVFLSSPYFLPASHCFTGWSKKNLKVYDLINNLNKNLITHFVWHLEKERRCGIETLFIDRVLNKEHFYQIIMQEMCTKS